jgi:thiol-disulfide isomerase/thioredoxin
MAEAMEQSKKQRKQERRRSAAEARAAAERRRRQRRSLAYGLGGLAVVAIVVLAVFALMGDAVDSADGTGGVEPSARGTVSVTEPARSEPLAAGDAVPDFTAPAVGGGSVRWSDFAGGPAVLSIWAPWCPHCQVELPLLDRVMRDFPGVGFVTIVTSIGDSPGPDPAAFLEEHGITAPTAIDDVDGTLAGAFGIQAFPTLYFVGSDGAVVQMAEGEVDEDTLRSTVGSLT